MRVENEFLTTGEVSSRKGVTGSAVRAAIGRGRLSAFEVGGRWFVIVDDKLQAYLQNYAGGRPPKNEQTNA